MQMPFVGARKAPPGTVVVIEVGLIDVKRENGRKREVNDYLWRQVPPTHHIPPRLPYPAASPTCHPMSPSLQQLKAEKVQQKLDRLEDAKLLRLRERRERQEKSDSVQLLLSGEADAKLKLLGEQKDTPPPAAADDGNGDGDGGEAAGAAGAVGGGAAAAAAAGVAVAGAEEVEVWAEAPAIDYEAFDEDAYDDDCWAPPPDDDTAEADSLVSLPPDAAAADSETGGGGGGEEEEGGGGGSPPPRPPAHDPWAGIDGLATADARDYEARVVAPPAAAPSPAPAAPEASEGGGETAEALLASLGLGAHWAALRADGLSSLEELKRLHAADHTALASRLGKLGLKMGPRQKLIAALR
jgi:hypothetical protein